MASKESELEVLKMVFAGMKEKYFTFDVDGDGTITNQEFRMVLEAMVGEPCPDEDWKEFIRQGEKPSKRKSIRDCITRWRLT
jgi:Ca2+-binding EF-hand superfamily protein